MSKFVMRVVLVLMLGIPGFSFSLTLPSIFSDHMVLQRDQAVPVWGSSVPGAAVAVEFGDQKKEAVAGADGRWRVSLDPMPASAEPRELKVSSVGHSETNSVRFSDVLVGEVWLCSGQSNMEWRMEQTEGAPGAIAAATNSLIRLYHTPRTISQGDGERIDAEWKVCSPETLKKFSGVAYYFGRKLHRDLNVPIGLWASAWGGTRIEPWTPPRGFKSVEGMSTEHRIASNLSRIPLSGNDQKDKQTPGLLYNGMLRDNVPFAIRGAIWYQGEANHRHNLTYVNKNRALLNGWRELWGYDFPFYFVQIAPYRWNDEDPEILPLFWEAQSEVVRQIPGTGMAIVNDFATADNIHPPNKEVPGERLALLAEAETYGLDVVSTGPVFKSYEKMGSRLKISFDSAEGLCTRDGERPDWFEIAGRDGVFKTAVAEIAGDSIVLSSPEVPDPFLFRYAWHRLAMPNLMNGAGLPAGAFRGGEIPDDLSSDAAGLDLPEMEGYRVVYRLDIPLDADYSSSDPDYSVDRSAADATPFSRIAYYLELEEENGRRQYVFASMDCFETDLAKIGVPVYSSGVKRFEQVSGLTVRSNVRGVEECTGSDGGVIEFWSGNYSQPNQSEIPGASSERFDYGDRPAAKNPGYGCLQVHNWKEKQTVLAFNHWGNAGVVDLGIGNAPGQNTDWTSSRSGSKYVLRRLTVLVK